MESILIVLQLLDLVTSKDPSYMQDVHQCLEDSDDHLDRCVLALDAECCCASLCWLALCQPLSGTVLPPCNTSPASPVWSA